MRNLVSDNRFRRSLAILALATAAAIGAQASAQESKPTAIEPPDRSKPYNDAVLELGENTVVTSDVKYSDDQGKGAELQTLDIYAPRGAQKLPVLIYIHGGGWSRGDKREVGAQPKLFNEQGVVFVAVNYRLAPEVKYPTNINDIAAGIGWVRANIDRYGGDPQKLVIMGHSAGSHLASLIATHPGPLGRQGLKVSDLKGAISLDGSGFNLVERLDGGDPKVLTAYTRAFGPDRAVYADASPIQHVGKGAGVPPFLLTYVKEDSVNYTQAKAFAERILASGGRAELAFIEGKDHATLASDLGTDRDTAGQEIVHFVRTVTGR